MGGYCDNQDEDGGWRHDSVGGCGEKLSDYGCILNMEPKGFSDRLDVEGLSNWKDGVAIFST